MGSLVSNGLVKGYFHEVFEESDKQYKGSSCVCVCVCVRVYVCVSECMRVCPLWYVCV